MLFSLILVSSLAIFADGCLKDFRINQEQERGGRNAQISAMKMGFFSENLELTEAETAKFWPLYMKNEKAKRELQRKKRDILNTMRDGKATLATVQEMFELDKERIVLDEQAVKEYSTVLSDSQIAKVFIAEEDFKAFLLHSFSGSKDDDQSGGRLMRLMPSE